MDGLLEIEVGGVKGEESIRGRDLIAEPFTGSGFRLLRTALPMCGFTAVINRLGGTFPGCTGHTEAISRVMVVP